jgi:hypothetical protein
LAERNSTPCIIKLIAAEKGIVCSKKDCSRVVDSSECRLLRIKSIFPKPIPVLVKPDEYIPMSSPTILDLIENAIPDNPNVKKKMVEVETVQEFMKVSPVLNQT